MKSNELAERIKQLVEERRDEIISDSQKIIQFMTVSGGSAAEQAEYDVEIPRCFDWLRERAEAMGFSFRLCSDGRVGEIEWKHNNPDADLCVIAAHIDVVTASGEWTYPPFAGTVAEGQLYGRGVQDDKGPLIQALHGLSILKDLEVDVPCTFRIVIGTQEETGDWSDINDYFAQERAPDYAFTPDADFPIINGEKGFLTILLESKWDPLGIDPETGLEIMYIRGGERENMVPQSCEFTVQFPKEHRSDVLKELVRTSTEFTVEHRDANVTLLPNKSRDVEADRHEAVLSFIGRGAHASCPQDGHNAVVDACDFLKSQTALPAPIKQFALFIMIVGSDPHGAAIGLDIEHHFIGKTTVCPVALEITGTGAKAMINIRPTMGHTPAEILGTVQKKAEEFEEATGLAISISKKGEGMEAIYLDPEDGKVGPFIQALREGFEAVTGQKAELRAVGGSTYSKAVPNCLAFGPTLDEPDTIHQANERAPVEAILRNVRIYGTSLGLLNK